jgi:PGF-pre-PGF domain-containing protein
MATSKKTLRILSFVGVLIISGSLMVGLFQSAGAVDITSSPDSNNVDTGDTVTFTVDVEVPEGETLPIEDVRGVVEETPNAGPGFDAKRDADLVADATCQGSIGPGLPDCPSSGDLSETTGNGIQAMEFVGGSPSDLGGYGYKECTTAPNGYCKVTHTGYDFTSDQNQGYGYERPELDGASYDLSDQNYGYGYENGKLTLNWEVTVDAGELNGAGDYWFTFIVETGSDVLGKLEGKAEYFEVTSSGTAGGGGGGGGGGTGGDGVSVVGCGEQFDATADERVKATTDCPDRFTSIFVEFSDDCTDCRLELTNHSSAAPDGTPSVGDSFRAVEYFSLDVLDEDGNEVEDMIAEGSLEFEVDQDEFEGDDDPGQVLLLHHTNPWNVQDTRLTSTGDADPLTYNATLPSFSVFAVVVDVQSPGMSNTQPTGEISAVTPRISADYDDNRAVDTDSFELEIDGTTQTSDDGELNVDEDGFEFVPAAGLDTGEHTVTATIEDTSGLSTTETWTFTVAEDACDPPPTITNLQPADEATGVEPDATITVTVDEGECAVETTTLTVNGETLEATLADGELTAQLPDSVGAMETVEAEASVTDTGGNAAERSWTFETGEETTPPPDDGPDDGGGGALVWVIVGLVVLAVIGVGAYFYMEEQ